MGPQSEKDTVWPPKELQPDWRHEEKIRGTQNRKQLILVWVEVRGLEWFSLRRGHLKGIWKVNRTFQEEGGGEESDSPMRDGHVLRPSGMKGHGVFGKEGHVPGEGRTGKGRERGPKRVGGASLPRVTCAKLRRWCCILCACGLY